MNTFNVVVDTWNVFGDDTETLLICYAVCHMVGMSSVRGYIRILLPFSYCLIHCNCLLGLRQPAALRMAQRQFPQRVPEDWRLFETAERER